MPLSDAVLALGSALAAPMYAAWRRKRGVTPDNTATLKELALRDHRDTLAAHNIQRDIEWLAEYTAQTLLPIFRNDGANLPENEHSAVALALTDTILSAGSFPSFLLVHNLDLDTVTAAYRKLGSPHRQHLAERSRSLYDACLPELIRRLLAIADGIPGFQSKFYQRLLANQAHLLDYGREILDEITRFMELHKTPRGYLVENFTYRLKAAIADRLGSVYILGLEAPGSQGKLPLDVSYLSVRAEVTKLHSGRSDIPFSVDIPCEYILTRSHRVLLRGNAGSGKTTFLQWIATRCVNKEFDDPLSWLNGFVPFFIRLREYYEAPLPVGRYLFSSVSGFLVDLVEDDWLRDILYRGRGLFLIDGLDELSSDQRESVQDWLRDLIRTTPQSIFVVTSRPTAVRTNFLHDEKFDEFFLKPMTPDEVDRFVEHWHDALRKMLRDEAGDEPAYETDVNGCQHRLEALLERNRLLKRFAATPLLAAVICTLNRNAKLDLISDRADMYETTARLLYHDRVIKKELKDPLYDSLSRAAKERLLAEIANWMIWNGKTACTMSQLARIIDRSWGIETEVQNSTELANALVLRSGVLKEITPESIQFLHKTFQEFFGAISAVKSESEMAVAKQLDLTEWREMFRIAVVRTNHRTANLMIETILERAEGERRTRSAYILLAGAATQDCLSILPELRGAVSEEMASLIPPRSGDIVLELAQAGELVVPMLRWRKEWDEVAVANSLALLAQLDTADSKQIILEYASRTRLTLEVVNRMLETTEYCEEPEFAMNVIRRLKKRNSNIFYKRGGQRKFYIASNVLLSHHNMWPDVDTLVVDGRWELDIGSALLEAGLRYGEMVRELTVVGLEGKRVNGEVIRGLEGLRILNLCGGFVNDVNFLSSLDVLNTLRCFDVGVGDWEGLFYGNVERVFVRGPDMDMLEILRKRRVRGLDGRERFDRISDFEVFVDLDGLEMLRMLAGEVELQQIGGWGVAREWPEEDQRRVMKGLRLAS